MFSCKIQHVLLKIEPSTLPTDAVFLEAVLGENTALDEYAKESLKTVALENDKIEKGLEIVNVAADKADAYVKINVKYIKPDGGIHIIPEINHNFIYALKVWARFTRGETIIIPHSWKDFNLNRGF